MRRADWPRSDCYRAGISPVLLAGARPLIPQRADRNLHLVLVLPPGGVGQFLVREFQMTGGRCGQGDVDGGVVVGDHLQVQAVGNRQAMLGQDGLDWKK